MLDVRFSEAENPNQVGSGPALLYVTYDGLLEPLGRSQVVGYLEGLARGGVDIDVVSFEKAEDLSDAERLAAMRARLESAAIRWTPLRYHRHPRAIATLWDLLAGSARARRLVRTRAFVWIHARSYVAALMGVAAKAASGGRAKLLFDMRGFWPEERVELGLFTTDGTLYRISKRVERLLLDKADHLVVLTASAKAVLRDREAGRRLATGREVPETSVTVIPCCVDLERFTPRPPDEALAAAHGLGGKLVIGNVGTFNSRYLVNDMFRFAYHVRKHRPETVFVYVTQHDPEPVRRAARDAGLADDALVVSRAEPDDVPRWLSLFRLGVFFLRPSYAAKASSFTKLGEFLACGVPVVTNPGVGDVDTLIGGTPCGLLVFGLTDRDLDAAARQALPLLEGAAVPHETRAHCRALATSELALSEGVRRYLGIYRAHGLERERDRERERERKRERPRASESAAGPNADELTRAVEMS